MEQVLKRLLLVALCSSLCSIASAAVYKYTDENGQTAYSDKPIEGAKKLKLPGTATRKRDSDNTAKQSSGKSEENQKPDKSVQYKSLEVLTPKHDKVVDGTSGDVEVILLATPKMVPGHQIVVTLDGKDISKSRHANLSLSQVPRGSHTLASRIIDKNGTTLIKAKPVTFHIKRPIIEKDSPLAFDSENN